MHKRIFYLFYGISTFKAFYLGVQMFYKLLEMQKDKNLSSNQQLQRTRFGFNNEMPFWQTPAAM